jgi:MFS transporter, PHS family, inorganic phosphate transporter
MGKVGAIIAQVMSIPLLNKDSPADCTGSACSPWLDRLMQIFALFMLSGLFVSLLIPETKGITLEELAGEAPTSYNGGRNDPLIQPPKRWWNIFEGGQPAGFLHRRAPKSNSKRNPRVGIMTSPEMVAQQKKQPAGGKKWKRTRGGSEDTGLEMSSTSSVRQMVDPVEEDPSVAHGVVNLPGWGAGWGRVDRGDNPTSKNIRLQDVGNLLK